MDASPVEVVQDDGHLQTQTDPPRSREKAGHTARFDDLGVQAARRTQTEAQEEIAAGRPVQRREHPVHPSSETRTETGTRSKLAV